ncbi:MAG: hypothetical protein ACOY7J_20285 [Pseudomonadota bacterium]
MKTIYDTSVTFTFRGKPKTVKRVIKNQARSFLLSRRKKTEPIPFFYPDFPDQPHYSKHRLLQRRPLLQTGRRGNYMTVA